MLDATVFSLFSPQAISHAFGFAIDVGFKSFVICAAALLLDRALGRRVLARSVALNACLIGLVLLPVAAIMLPQLKLNFVAGQASGKLSAEMSPFAPRKGAVSRNETRQNAEMRRAAAASPAFAPAHELSPFAPRKDAVSRSETRQRAETRPAARPFDWRPVVLLTYAAVVLAALFRLSRSLLAVASLKRSGNLLTQPAWNERLVHWQARLGVSRPVALLSTDRVDVPVVVGWRRPAILAPERLTAVDRKTIDAVLLHELAHVRRGDYAWNLLLRLVHALYWPNPLLWLVGRSLSRVREQACDEVCIHWLGGSEEYRATLVELAGSLLRRPLAALGMAMAGSSRLQRRLEQLGASRGRAECQSRAPWRFAALVVVGLTAGALGALRFTNRAAADPTNRVHIVIDKDKLRADESKVHKDRDRAAIEVAQADPPPVEKAEPSESAAPAAEPKEEQPQPPEKQPERSSPSKTANEGASEAAENEPAEPVKVRVEKVRREDFVVQTSQPGTLKPSRTMELYAKVDGLIIARHFNVGDVVKAGQVLAEIDAPELDAELEQTKALAEEGPAAVGQAQGKLDEASAGLEGANAELNKSQADLKQAESQLESAEKMFKRLKDFQGAVVAEKQLAESEGRVQTAQGAILVVKAQGAAAKAKVKQAEATVAVAKAGLRIAQLHLGAARQALKRVEQRAAYRQIKAPADGVVVRQAAEPGSFAKLGGEPLFVISGTNVLTMQTQIPERDALRVAPGQHARVWFDAQRDGKPHDSKVSRVGYVIDPKTRTMSVEIDLDNSDGRLRPGMYGRVAIDLETHPGVLTMSPKFVFPGYCFRLVDGRAVKTQFEWAQSWDDPDGRQEIKNGLSEGDVVIIGVISPAGEPWNLITDGSVVEILDQEQ